MKATTLAFAAVLAVLSGAAHAQSYGAGDPARADTTDPNSAPTARAIHHPQASGMHHRHAMWQHRTSGWSGAGGNAYASGASQGYGSAWHGGGWGGMGSNMYQSGGNGSPVAAGSLRGSTDRSDPSSPYASGPYGDGELWRGR